MQQENSDDNSVDQGVEALFAAALQHYREGRLRQAQDQCTRILRRQRRPDAILILAKIAHEQKEFKVAVERYQQLLEIIPGHAQSHFWLGMALEELGHTERAIEHYRRSISIAPDDAAAHGRLADACCKIQRWEEAIEAYRQVLVENAGDVGAMLKLGQALTEAKLIPESIQLYQRVLALLPDNALVHRRLGAAFLVMGQLEDAVKSFEQALSLRPDYVPVLIDLALAQRQLGRAEEALVTLGEAIRLRPANEEAHINLALTHKQLGQQQLAIEGLQRFLAIQPTCGRAWYHISIIKPEQDHVPAVEALLSDPDLPQGEAMYGHFALGNMLDCGASHDQAFEHYLEANRLQRETLSYDPADNTRYVDSLIEVYSAGFLQAKGQFGSASQLPVFIVGMPRSGTTLVEQILSSHPEVHGAGEIRACPAINYSIAHQLKYSKPDPECMALIDSKMIAENAARYLRDLTFHCPTAVRITDKEPGNFFRIGLIKTLFPAARIIHCQRDPLDNCISVFFHCFTAFQSSFELTELGKFYRDYQRLMAHWQSVLPGEILTVRYEELVEDQEGVSKRLVDHLGLEWDARCLDFHHNERNVMSPSNIQVRQPMYGSSINRWQRYAAHLQPLIAALQAGAGKRDT